MAKSRRKVAPAQATPTRRYGRGQHDGGNAVRCLSPEELRPGHEDNGQVGLFCSLNPFFVFAGSVQAPPPFRPRPRAASQPVAMATSCP